jgi:hypothetical protein
MKSTNAERMNLPIWQSLRAKNSSGVMKFRARWQTAFDTVSGQALWKLRLEMVHSVSQLLTHLNA